MPLTLPSRLYVICDEVVCERSGWSLTAFAGACLDGGARLLQVRAKRLSGRALLDVCTEIVDRARAVDALAVINDRADIARLSGAGAVHVGQDDLPPAAVRAVAGRDIVVGLSTHTPAQLTEALAQPIDYAAIGPVYGTATKDAGYAPLGLDEVRRAALVVGGRIPLVAIGGLTLDRARATIDAGAAAVAVISDVLTGGDPSRRVAEYLAALR